MKVHSGDKLAVQISKVGEKVMALVEPEHSKDIIATLLFAISFGEGKEGREFSEVCLRVVLSSFCSSVVEVERSVSDE